MSGDLNATGYGYNGPHRLTGVTIGGVANTLGYDANGNITQYTAASGPSTWLSYDARNNVRQIHVGATQSTIQARDEFWYDADGQRFLGRESWDDNGTLRTRTVVYLGGDYEEVIPPTGGTHDRIQRVQVTAVVRQMRRRNASTQMWDAVYHEYAHRDHLGSVDAITDGTGAVLQKTSFDPYGGRRATAWNADLPATGLDALRAVQDSRGSRGFTDHEHLSRTGFVHMNGRVYDPRIGRFVSPDPIVQAPWFSQSYNRYAYVFGSPVSFTDPSGFCSFSATSNHDTLQCPMQKQSNKKKVVSNSGTFMVGSSGSRAPSKSVRGGGSTGSSVRERIAEVKEQEGPELEVVEAVSVHDPAGGETVSSHDLAVEVASMVGTDAATIVIDESLGLRGGSPVGSVASIVVEIAAQAGLDTKDPAAMVAVYVSAPIGGLAGAATGVVIGGGAVFTPFVVGMAVAFGVHQLVVHNYKHIAPPRRR